MYFLLLYFYTFKMERRSFLKWIIWLWTWILLHHYTNAEILLKDEVKTEVNDLLLLENIKKYEKSVVLVWEREVQFFIKFFNILGEKEVLANNFVKMLQIIQTNFKIPLKLQDWILQASILKKIYIEYYSKVPEKLDHESKKRLNIYNEMLWYEKKQWAITSKFDVFLINEYYGDKVWLNKYWTLINEKLIWKIPENINEVGHKIIISKLDKKKILTFYVNGKLYLATYVSPWLLKHKTPKLKTNGKIKPDKYHTSSEYPEVKKKKKWRKWWAVMPYAVHIDWWVRIHGSSWRIDGNLASHWCIRTPLFYVKEIYEKVTQLWINNVMIDTTWIY